MNMHEALQKVVNDAAEMLALPVGWDGEVFTPPLASHLRAKILYDDTRYASLGTTPLKQTEGRIEIRVVVVAGDGDTFAQTLAQQLTAFFPRGTDLPVDHGELTLKTCNKGNSTSEGSRLFVTVTVPFYALIQE